jgi:hypothetical protein
MTSKPKIAARDRRVVVGVEGRELFPVENLNNPYWWTESEDGDESCTDPNICTYLSVRSDREREPFVRCPPHLHLRNRSSRP